MHSREPLRFVLPLMRTPHIFRRVLPAIWTKHVGARREYRRKDGISRLPIQQISIRITHLCNLRCKTCGQWGDTGYNHGKSREEIADTVPLETYLDMVDRFRATRPVYYLWGGEPFLYPGLMDLTARIKEAGSLLALVTNATLLNRYAEEIVRQKWDALMVSVDGPPATHNSIRGQHGAFEKLAAGLAAVQECKRAADSRLPWIMPLVTVSVDNASVIDGIFAEAEKIGADCIVVYYSWFTSEEVGRRHTHIMESRLDTTPTAWKGYLFDHDVDTDALKASLGRVRARTWPFPSIFIPDLKDGQLSEYYRKPEEFFGYGPCTAPWTNVEIMPDGSVTPCRDYPDYVVGNIREQPLEDIWNGERFIRFRQALQESGGTFPICARCCGLMGW